MSNGNNIISILIIAIVAYVVLSSKDLLSSLIPGLGKSAPVSTTVSDECPRGQKYYRGFFVDCDPNYMPNDFVGIPGFGQGLDCICQSQIRKAAQQNITGTANNASQDRQETTNLNAPSLPHPVIPDPSPMGIIGGFLTDVESTLSGTPGGSLVNWIFPNGGKA